MRYPNLPQYAFDSIEQDKEILLRAIRNLESQTRARLFEANEHLRLLIEAKAIMEKPSGNRENLIARINALIADLEHLRDNPIDIAAISEDET